MAQCSVRRSTRNLSSRLSRFLSSAVSVHQEPLTLWHKTSKLLPNALENTEEWDSVLSQAFDDLSKGSRRPIELVVHGVDKWAGAEDLVTALLADPLGPEQQWKTIQNRWKDGDQQLTISHSPNLTLQDGKLSLPSTYLQQFPAPIQITEVLDEPGLPKLFEADIPILVCNPLATSLPALLTTPLPTNTIIIIRAPANQSIDTMNLLSNVPSYAPKPTIILADPSRGSAVIDFLQSSSGSTTSPTTVQRFQDEFTGSNVSAVTAVLQRLLSVAEPQAGKQRLRGTASDYLRIRFALLRLEDALTACISSAEGIKLRLDAASVEASRLHDQVEETGAKVEVEVLGPSISPVHSTTRNPRRNQVTEALNHAEKGMQQVMDRLTWWRMLSRVDDITNIVASAMQRTWCPELERNLLLQTGQLSALQKELSSKSFKLLSNNDVVQSNVLRNTLLQLQSSPTYELTTTSLTSAITSRRNQIIEYPTARLHLAGQRTVLGMSTGICGGATVGWTGWMGWLVQSGDGLLSAIGLEPSTAMAVGALGAVASVRWGVGRWEKAKGKWWEDWRRVGEGLDRDLRGTLHRNFRERVSVLARAASQGVKAMVERREEEVAQVNDEARELREVVKGAAEQSQS